MWLVEDCDDAEQGAWSRALRAARRERHRASPKRDLIEWEELASRTAWRALRERHPPYADLGNQQSSTGAGLCAATEAEEQTARMETAEESSERNATDFLRRLPKRSPADLVALVRQQGKSPVTRFQDLLGQEADGDDTFDVDAFLLAREQWQTAERLLDEERAVWNIEEQ